MPHDDRVIIGLLMAAVSATFAVRRNRVLCAVADPAARARLAAALHTMPADVLEYKDLRDAAHRLIEHLGGVPEQG